MRAGLLALLLLAGCAREMPARPALYVLRDADTTIWLLGTVHFLPPGVRWETPAVKRAIADSAMLVGELPGDADASTAFAQASEGRGLPPLAARVPPGDQARLKAAMKDCGGARLDRLKSWAAALVLSACGAAAAGGDPEHGVESVLARRFAGRSRLGLETVAGQFALFDGLGETDQRRLLRASLAAGADYRALLGAWTAGDEARLAALIARSFAGAPTLKATLLDQRNARWSAWIGDRMRKPGKLLIAVGAGHLAGSGSVIARLRAAGFRIERVGG
ncbi:MAG: TraB/GumN family protein [Sphingomonas sp.]|uniref:TraB/GumN family protein n=1 Tax=Sphingomonas sp. TaxID=28214 RepID=UPI0025D902FB|nr:TraB/GumN family protein [Sphingomonas sp.]MBX9882587.1 TraB/GumN family protein [Sphingomonas sp.]